MNDSRDVLQDYMSEEDYQALVDFLHGRDDTFTCEIARQFMLEVQRLRAGEVLQISIDYNTGIDPVAILLQGDLGLHKVVTDELWMQSLMHHVELLVYEEIPDACKIKLRPQKDWMSGYNDILASFTSGLRLV